MVQEAHLIGQEVCPSGAMHLGAEAKELDHRPEGT